MKISKKFNSQDNHQHLNRNCSKKSITVKTTKLQEKNNSEALIPRSILLGDIPSTYKIVGVVIYSMRCTKKDNTYMPSNAEIATIVNKSIQTVRKAIKYLKTKGLLDIEIHFEDEDYFSSN